MAHNIEIKARVPDFDALLARAGRLAGTEPELIVQTDTFFAVPRGRLKLREFADGRGELIAYERPNDAGPKTSRYALAPCNDARAMGSLLATMLGVAGTVHKTRRLFLAGRTRIHLDTVEGLGAFMELEVVLAAGESALEGEQEALRLMAELGIRPENLVKGAYIDLMGE